MTESRNTVFDFFDRTLRNLERVEECNVVDEKSFFEVTQLINSCLGVIVFPSESKAHLWEDLPAEELIKDLLSPRILYGKQEFKNGAVLIKLLRNSIAHNNLYFENRNNSIVGLYAWNLPGPKAHKPDWVIYISIEDLRTLLKRFVEKVTKNSKANEVEPDRLSELEKKVGETLRQVILK